MLQEIEENYLARLNARWLELEKEGESIRIKVIQDMKVMPRFYPITI